jgi:hypothetical protein
MWVFDIEYRHCHKYVVVANQQPCKKGTDSRMLDKPVTTLTCTSTSVRGVSLVQINATGHCAVRSIGILAGRPIVCGTRGRSPKFRCVENALHDFLESFFNTNARFGGCLDEKRVHSLRKGTSRRRRYLTGELLYTITAAVSASASMSPNDGITNLVDLISNDYLNNRR